ncbi:hypothetical protein LTR84_002667 [Exophiala bonariae]|uniref:Major facilitator superfamily (MFS) profile domain-containing protein n=1 Tax=Exophiala bonariae TaxID=1690606 RepID=A0AAV9N8L8_9EURO|nr:hypothetical protein LTR84_002667 [Exophiala bonariae]
MAFFDYRKIWYRLSWFSTDDTKEERRLIWKLDLLILPYSLAVYIIKYIDQANINNAYVGGMKEDLGFHGNELVHFQTIYILGAVLGQIPFLFLLTRIRIHQVIPILDIAWGIFTLLQYRSTGYTEVMVYRFFVGWFEAPYFITSHYVFGSWYKRHEIARRAGIWYTAQNIGTLTAGLIQAAASSKLDGVNGLAGWRWMYIICACITIPVGIIGFFILPGTPDRPSRVFLSQDDIDLAAKRLHDAGHVTSEEISWGTLKRVLSCRLTWALLSLDLFFWGGSTNVISGGFLLWLKSLNRYSSAKINSLGSLSPAIGIFYTLLVSTASDLVLGPAWAITMAHTLNIIGLIILITWKVPETALWFAFMTTYAANSVSGVLYSWVNSVLSHSPVERSFTLVFINMISQSTVAWTPLLVFKTVEAPRFTKGYSFVMGNAICLIIFAHVIRRYLSRRAGYVLAVPTDVGMQADTKHSTTSTYAPENTARKQSDNSRSVKLRSLDIGQVEKPLAKPVDLALQAV